ncbi:nuclear pore complex protein nup50a [Phtheirospermum japonicum]|uniref:Nuclear pore complex protein nup50a n=1 Tax=Phtheirospermum japonicum TaxID=374723 RepID=A0A830DFH6_9LAMI|nr:nuclear pore complex protein nup50a [Phtheirospermum japonicum]
MGDAENNSQPSKKRAARVQLSRDNPGLDDNEDSSEQEAGTFKRASDEVLATRRIVKVRRPPTSSSAQAPPASSNPFAAIRLVTSGQNQETEQTDDIIQSENKADEAKGDGVIKSENKVDEARGDDIIKSENKADETKGDDVIKSAKPKSKVDDHLEAELNAQKDKTEPAEVKNATEGDNSETNVSKDLKDEKKESGDENAPKNEETSSFSSFQNLSSGQNAFSGITGTGFSSSSFSFGSLSNDNSSIFGSSASNSVITKSEGSKFPPMQEVSVETGEENEKAVFTADSALFEFTDGSWKERGKGELKVNVPTGGAGKARLVMRARGNYRLILNASLFPDMKLTNMEKKGVTFACVNSASEVKNGLSTIALKFKDASFVEDFRAAVMEHKAKSGVALKTPENSPKVSDE